MGAGAGFDYLAQAGVENANRKASHKQAMSDAQFQEKHNEIQGMIDNLQTKLASVPESDRNNPDYLKLKDQLAQTLQDRDAHWKSLEHPSAILKFTKMLGRDLRFPKKEDATPVAPPVYGQPTMDVDGVKVPTGAAYKVQGPQTPAQQKAQTEASQLEAAAPLSPEQVATQKANAEAASDLTAVQAKMKNLKTLFPDAPKEQMDKWGMELVQNVMQLKPTNEKYFTQLATTKDDTGKEHYWRVPMSADEKPEEVDFNGQTMIPKNTKPTKMVKGDLIRVKPGQSPTGWVRLLYDPTDPTNRKYVPATPSRLYMGTESSDVTKDPFGVTSTSTRTTTPMNQSVVDLTGIPMASPGEYEPTGEEVPTSAPSTPQPSANPSPLIPQNPKKGETTPTNHPAASPKSSAVKLPTQTPNATGGEQTKPNPYGSQYPPLNADYHIPDTAKVNPQLREAANQLLDGVDIKEIQVPARDKMAVDAIARQYGWGRGPYTPRELKQMQNANQFLDAVLKSKSFMKALDEGVYQRSKMAEAEKDASKDSLFGTIFHQMAVSNLKPEQQEYLRLRAAMLGTVSGLSSVVRSGRPTEATINRLANEIPTVLSSANSKDARKRIANIKRELKLALEQGVPKPTSPRQEGSGGASNPGADSGQVDKNALLQKMIEHVRGK